MLFFRLNFYKLWQKIDKIDHTIRLAEIKSVTFEACSLKVKPKI